MALAFHPGMVSEFNLVAKDSANGPTVLQIHFAQRPDRPNRLRSYLSQNTYYPIPLKGRVWIDAGTFQIRHFESELMNPMPEIWVSALPSITGRCSFETTRSSSGYRWLRSFTGAGRAPHVSSPHVQRFRDFRG